MPTGVEAGERYVNIVTSQQPVERGCQLSLQFSWPISQVHKFLAERGVMVSLGEGRGVMVSLGEGRGVMVSLGEVSHGELGEVRGVTVSWGRWKGVTVSWGGREGEGSHGELGRERGGGGRVMVSWGGGGSHESW